MQPKISVIVPIYNAERYLRRCLDSVLAQTHQNIEIILVDDGSTDSSGLLCDVYAQKNSCANVLHTQNNGVSSARNAGLGTATGDYLAFIDSDDFVAPKMLEKLLAALLENDADMSICGYQRTDENGRPTGPESSYPACVLTGIHALEKLYTNDYIYFTIPCNKLFKKALFDDIRFPQGKRYEDGYAAFRYLLKSKKVACLFESYYFYVSNPESFTRIALSITTLDAIDADMDSLCLLNDNGLNNLVEKAQSKLVMCIVTNLRRFDLGQKDIAKRFYAVRKTFVPLYPGIIKNRAITKKEKLLITSFIFSPRLCKSIIKVRKL